jgi:GNAT superfamily N-acetyltransferase
MDIDISGPANGAGKEIEAILRELPDWFGIEEAILDYAREVAGMPTFYAKRGGKTLGFLSLKEHFPEAAEIHVMAVRPEAHGSGIGTALVEKAEIWLKNKGCRVLQVKTLGESRESEHYARTRAFYRKLGFAPLEELKGFWSHGNPCLISVKPL